MKFSTTLAAVASVLSTARAHGGVDTYTVGTTVYQGFSPYNPPAGQTSLQRQYVSYDPLLIKDLSTVNIRCNNAGVLGTGVSGTIAAGAKLKAHWKQWTHRPAATFVYMAKCPSAGCDNWDGSGKVWFKIYHQGLISGTEQAGIWAGDAIVDTLELTVTIPATLASGNYLIRHELLALHQGNNPQFYPECAQFAVTGSGTTSPPASALVAFPGAYSASDPGIAFNIDSADAKTATTYPIPGPAVWDGTGTGAAPGTDPAPVPSTPASPAGPVVKPTPTLTPEPMPTTFVTSAAPATPTAPTCAAVKKYGQCGGKTYAGCTVCEAGSKCTANGDYYSQCV